MFIPHGLDAILTGAVLFVFATKKKRRRRSNRKNHLAVIGLLIETLFFFGGLTLVIYGVMKNFN
ncbi:MAG: hypothetical protein WCT08_03510 [Patescibacteria group bacterium]